MFSNDFAYNGMQNFGNATWYVVNWCLKLKAVLKCPRTEVKFSNLYLKSNFHQKWIKFGGMAIDEKYIEWCFPFFCKYNKIRVWINELSHEFPFLHSPLKFGHNTHFKTFFLMPFLVNAVIQHSQVFTIKSDVRNMWENGEFTLENNSKWRLWHFFNSLSL